LYAALVLVYVSKLRATTSFIARTPLAMFMYGDVHELHVYCGWTILIFSLIHTVFHFVRWGQQGNLSLLFTHVSGITGLIIILSCILICIPMTIFRAQIRYELRKKMHYLFLLFALALCFHTPTSAIPNGGFTGPVFGTILVWYFLDALYCYFFMTEKIDTTKFHVLPTGVRMTLAVSERFQKMGAQGGYCYVCLPWVDKQQWHAFSLFENPTNPAEREIFMMKLGDWTNDVHEVLQRDTVRPAWVHGPFPSPYNSAEEYDNQILVASGIGITPALSVIRAHKDSRRINLIWAVRDKYLLEFFLNHLYLDHQGWNLIFYTGKEKLDASEMNVFTNTNVCIIAGRPNLKDLIPNIIYGIESGVGLPERYNQYGKMVASELLGDILDQSSDDEEGSPHWQAELLSSYASDLGFQLSSDAISQELHASQEIRSSFEHSEPFSPQRRRTSEAIMCHLGLGFRPWLHQEGAVDFVKNLDTKLVLPTWGILYCGGAKVMERDLREIADVFDLDIHIESFAW
jgi:ferric-chelate reductase